MSLSLAMQFLTARTKHRAVSFLKRVDYSWPSSADPIVFADGSQVYLSGMDRHLTDKEVTKAVARYCRHEGHYASFVRTNTLAMSCALREWRLDYQG